MSNSKESQVSSVLPKHIGFIMDGNRRWAKERGLVPTEGHNVGAENMMTTVKNCRSLGIKYVTVYAFSTENWNRSKREIDFLMKLFKKKILGRVSELNELGVKVNVIGRVSDWPAGIQKQIFESMEITKGNNKLIFNIAMSYGGRAEIIDAVKRIIEDDLKPGELTEEKFADYIYESGQPDPELIIRTSGEKRLSGFMLWQSSYSELFFSDKYWPDFDMKELEKAINWFSDVKRNFGS